MDILIRVENGIGRITLNRPRALNALTTDMCAAIDAALIAWADDPLVRLVLIDHADGTRGFCAGGDIRFAAQSGRGDGKAVPPLVGNGAVTAGGPQDVIRVVLGGVMAHGTYGPMPAIGATMSDSEPASGAQLNAAPGFNA